jgi:hypothetical protein
MNRYGLLIELTRRADVFGAVQALRLHLGTNPRGVGDCPKGHRPRIPLAQGLLHVGRGSDCTAPVDDGRAGSPLSTALPVPLVVSLDESGM